MLRAVGRLLAGAVALAGAASSPLLAQGLDNGLDQRLGRLERALREGDAAALRQCVSGRARVHVDLRGLTDGRQVWGAGQLEVAFAGIFSKQLVSAFVLDRATLTRAGGELAFVRGTWTRRAATGPLEEGLTFTLRQESADWRVFEIRTSR